MWAATAGMIAYSAREVKGTLDERRVPLMGVLGAFVFAAQMINFTIPGTGSSGHLGGGMILSILLGPHAAFLAIASVLSVQALFFADGGLLALGCNVFNLGFFPAFVAYPLVYRPIAGATPSAARRSSAAVLAAVFALQIGAFGVVLETTLSGVSDLPFGAFVLLMQPIHLAIGLVEGLATAAVVGFVVRARPDVICADPAWAAETGLRPIVVGLLVATVAVGGALSWFASSDPDGLEWAIEKLTGGEENERPNEGPPPAGAHEVAAGIQERTAFLPDYGFKPKGGFEPKGPGGEPEQAGPAATGAWPAVDAGTSVSGIVGGAIVLVLVALVGFALRARPRRTPREAEGAPR
jgi:cobalt/nickel transport system permease protein